MKNGIIQTALTGLPLELEYQPYPALDEGRSTHSGLPSQQSEQIPSDEFACLLRVI
jgi:hypothetical protein